MVLVYLVLPNVLGLAIARSAGMERALIDVDFLVLACVEAVLSRRLAAFLLAIAVSLDAAITLAPLFGFDDTAFVAAIPDIGHLPMPYIAAILFVELALSFLMLKLIPRAQERRAKYHTIGAVIFLIVVVSVDLLNGSNSMSTVPVSVVPVNIATSPVLRVALGVANSRNASKLSPELKPIEAATDVLRAELRSSPQSVLGRDSVIVVVLIESLGLFVDSRAVNRLWAPLQQPAIRRRYAVRTGSVPFTGHTTSAELRELCGLQGSHRDVLRRQVPECLPATLAKLGYRTVADHGYSSSLFARNVWYPILGFERLRFRREVKRDVPVAECGTLFRGVCDADMARVVATQIAASRGASSFIYWVTLSSHFPLDRHGAENSSLACADLGSAAGSESTCLIARMISGVIEAVARVALDDTLPPTRFILVGDHSPPFGPEGRMQFVRGRVPFLELVPMARGVAFTGPRSSGAVR